MVDSEQCQRQRQVISHTLGEHMLKRRSLWAAMKKVIARLLYRQCSDTVEMSNVFVFST
jgi:hypothetical protein